MWYSIRFRSKALGLRSRSHVSTSKAQTSDLSTSCELRSAQHPKRFAKLCTGRILWHSPTRAYLTIAGPLQQRWQQAVQLASLDGTQRIQTTMPERVAAVCQPQGSRFESLLRRHSGPEPKVDLNAAF